MSSDDKLTIETPEQTALEFPLAGVGSRALALALDTLVQAGAMLVFGIIALAVSWAGFLPQVSKQWTYAILIFLMFVLNFGYYAFFETIWNGRTPGKRWTHLRVISDSGQPIGAQGAILRNLMRIVDALPSLYAIGIVTSLLSRQNKRFGDYVAGTVVIHEKPVEGGRDVWTAQVTQATQLTSTASRRLNPAELQLVEAFLERRASLQESVRRSMARQITDRLNQGQPISSEAAQDPEKYLVALAEQSRNAAHFR
jgi:uncharacterized RDD family membrane protein YckC